MGFDFLSIILVLKTSRQSFTLSRECFIFLTISNKLSTTFLDLFMKVSISKDFHLWV